MYLHCGKKTHKNKGSLPNEDKLLMRVPNKMVDVFLSPTIALVVTQNSPLLQSVASESYTVEMWAKLFLQAENKHKVLECRIHAESGDRECREDFRE